MAICSGGGNRRAGVGETCFAVKRRSERLKVTLLWGENMLRSLVCISAGASAGAILRWLLGLALNAAFPLIPLGTLAANLMGGYLVGVAVSGFALLPSLGPEWRLLVITGFLGGLTTFSTFSAEVSALVVQQRLAAALLSVSLHVCGSLSMTFLGMGTVSMLRSALRWA